jgi:hypothetical protein
VGFEAALDAILHSGLNENRVHPMMMLALDMILAEFNRTEFMDPYEEASLQKPHIIKTPLLLAHSDMVTERLRLIC